MYIDDINLHYYVTVRYKNGVTRHFFYRVLIVYSISVNAFNTICLLNSYDTIYKYIVSNYIFID